MNKLKQICNRLEEGLIERNEAIRLALLAALSGEHVLLLGSPGTAKSQLARKLKLAFESDAYFERLLTRFSVPEELFGPLSIKSLEQDRYQRLTRNYLPEASIAFIDEIFKANSAILNSLLTLLNEREFDNGCERISTPLISVIAASNELPEEDGLDALYDRFLLRYHVEPVSNNGFDELLDLAVHHETIEDDYVRLSNTDLKEIQDLSRDIPLSESARKLLHECRKFLDEQSVYVSDRRWRKALKCLKVSAMTMQQTEITVWDCALLVHILWHSPDQQKPLIEWYLAYLDLDIETTVSRLNKLVDTWENKLHEDTHRSVQKTNVNGEYLYLTPDGKTTTQHEHVSLATRDGEVLYLAPSYENDRTNNGKGYTLSELEKTFFDKSFRQTHIDGKWVDLQNYTNNTQNRLVDRISYEPYVEASYYSREYIDNQHDDLQNLLLDIGKICQHYTNIENELGALLKSHLWLSSGLLSTTLQEIIYFNPRLVDFRQRMDKLLKINSELNVKSMAMND